MPPPMGKRLGYVLKRAQHALRIRMDEALLPLALTTPQYSVLSAVELAPGISNAALARAAFVTAQTMQGIVTNLERDGVAATNGGPGTRTHPAWRVDQTGAQDVSACASIGGSGRIWNAFQP